MAPPEPHRTVVAVLAGLVAVLASAAGTSVFVVGSLTAAPGHPVPVAPVVTLAAPPAAPRAVVRLPQAAKAPASGHTVAPAHLLAAAPAAPAHVVAAPAHVVAAAPAHVVAAPAHVVAAAPVAPAAAGTHPVAAAVVISALSAPHLSTPALEVAVPLGATTEWRSRSALVWAPSAPRAAPGATVAPGPRGLERTTHDDGDVLAQGDGLNGPSARR